MIVSLGRDLRLHLLEVTDFQAFRVDIPSGSQISEIAGKIGPAVVFESEQVGWVSESWLREQGTDAAWSDRLARMVEKARSTAGFAMSPSSPSAVRRCRSALLPTLTPIRLCASQRRSLDCVQA